MKSQERDTYLDFLRGFGLLMLVVAHTWAPAWLATWRTFDVPLMVFVSCICYKPLRGGYLAYGWKRFKRIYNPVAVFLVIFFAMSALSYWLTGRPHLKLSTVAGSFLLLNWPSIGYVWIMRVFLMMALLVPLLYAAVKRAGMIITAIVVFGIIVAQHFFVEAVTGIDNKIVRFVADETLLYAVGYSAIAVIGLKIRDFSMTGLYVFLAVTGCAILTFVGWHDWTFDPQAYKYAPQSLYLLYGIFGSVALWCLKPVLAPLTTGRFFRYLSENSMWLYLWHIIPVYLIAPLAEVPNMWVCRDLIVLLSALMLNYAYQHAVEAGKKIFTTMYK